MSVVSSPDVNQLQTAENLEQLAALFQFDDANIIIRAGGVDFLVHRFVLSRASPVFKDMFSLPGNLTAKQESLPVIEVEEDAQTIHNVLSLLYFNLEDLDSSSLRKIQRILLVARKYSMAKLQTHFAQVLKRKAVKDPVRVFVIACKAALREVARAAAVQLLTWDYETLSTCDTPEFTQLHTKTLLKLLRYHRSCAEVALETIRIITNPTRYEKNEYSFPCPIYHHNHTSAVDRAGARVDCREWWLDYLDRIKGDVKSHPLGVAYRDPEVLKHCCRNAHKCTTCAPNATYNLLKAGENLEKGVRAAVMQVELILDEDDFLI